MDHKLKAWLLIILLALVCLAGVWGVGKYRAKAITTPEAMFNRVRRGHNPVVYIDFAALRQSGLLDTLSASKISEEPEYRAFVRQTDFNYRTDLDAAVISFAAQQTWFLLKGRFDWGTLKSYASENGGDCREGVCKVKGSNDHRNISWVPVAPNLMGMAVGEVPDAAQKLRIAGDPSPIGIPAAPVWMYIPGDVLRAQHALPDGTRMFVRTVQNSESIVATLGPDRDRFALKLEVTCRSEQDAATVAGELEHATNLVREAISREHQTPNPRDLSGVLSSGSFQHKGSRVYAYWPIQRVFFEELLGGGA